MAKHQPPSAAVQRIQFGDKVTVAGSDKPHLVTEVIGRSKVCVLDAEGITAEQLEKWRRPKHASGFHFRPGRVVSINDVSRC